MRSLAEIHALYGEINARLEAALSLALASGDLNLADRTLRKQVLNDQAYFVLSWGQIESEINDRCRDAIVTRQADPRWEMRRAWDIYNPSERRLSGLAFQDRAALVTDRAAGRGGVFAMIM